MVVAPWFQRLGSTGMVPPVAAVRVPATTSASRFAAPVIRAGFAQQGNRNLAQSVGSGCAGAMMLRAKTISKKLWTLG
jgi:hypothetical protein